MADVVDWDGRGMIFSIGTVGGVHITTSGIGAFSSGIVFCAMSGCTSVMGAETRKASDWGVAAATGRPPDRAACICGCTEACIAPPPGDHCNFGSNPCSLTMRVVYRCVIGGSSILGASFMASTARPRTNPCVAMENMKNPGRVRGGGSVEKIVMMLEELNVASPTPKASPWILFQFRFIQGCGSFIPALLQTAYFRRQEASSRTAVSTRMLSVWYRFHYHSYGMSAIFRPTSSAVSSCKPETCLARRVCAATQQSRVVYMRSHSFPA